MTAMDDVLNVDGNNDVQRGQVRSGGDRVMMAGW